MSVLLDVNILLALAWPNHQFHRRARQWHGKLGKRTWCTCAITQLGFVRLSSNPAFTAHAKTPLEAILLLSQLTSPSTHRFVNDLPSTTTRIFRELATSLQGYKQITDAYLVALASEQKLILTTFDHRIDQYAPDGVVEVLTV